MALAGLLRAAWPRKNSYSRDVVGAFAANLYLAAISAGSGVLLARILGPTGRGQLAAIQALPLLVGSIGMLGLQDAIVYFGARERKRVGEFALSATVLILALGVPITLVSALVVPLFLREHTPEVIFASRIYLGVLFVNALIGFSVFTVRAVHNMRAWNGLRILPQTTWVLVIVALALAGLATPSRIALVYLAAFFVLACVCLLAIRGPLRQGWPVNRKLWRKLLGYSLPLAAGSTPQFLGERTDQLIVAALLPAHDLGLYAVGVSWSLLMMLPGSALFGVAFSKVAAMPAPAEQWRFMKKATWAIVLASLGMGVVLGFTAQWVVPFAFGERFRPAVPAAAILVIAGGLRNVARMLQVGLKGCGRPSGVLYSEWGGVFVLLVAISVLTPRYGLEGAAWSVVLSGGTAAVIALLRLRRWAAGIAPPD